jgi:hypothetical protein
VFLLSPTRWRAAGALAAIVALLLTLNALNVANSYVGRNFITAIAERDRAKYTRFAILYIGVFKKEGDLRYGLIHVREHGTPLGERGESQEGRRIRARLRRVVHNSRAIIGVTRNVGFGKMAIRIAHRIRSHHDRNAAETGERLQRTNVLAFCKFRIPTSGRIEPTIGDDPRLRACIFVEPAGEREGGCFNRGSWLSERPSPWFSVIWGACRRQTGPRSYMRASTTACKKSSAGARLRRPLERGRPS